MNKRWFISEAMLAHGVDHHINHLPSLDHLIDKVHDILHMDIIVIGSVSDEQPPMEVFGRPNSVRIYRP